MKKHNFENEALSKKIAIKYFPEFFGSDYILLNGISLEELNEKYLEYCKNPSSNISTSDEYDKVMIKKAYDYLCYMLIANKYAIQLKSNVTKSLLKKYDNLVNLIAAYRFNAKCDGTYGDNQNKANQHILFEISLLRPYLIGALEDIDSYIENDSNIDIFRSFDEQLINRLENLGNQLINTYETLNSASSNYHSRWNSTYRSLYYGGYATESDLGKAKTDWKKQKNYAVHIILNFYKEINTIVNQLAWDDKIYIVDSKAYEYEELYENGISNIESGPYYYSYLSDEEKQELIAQNVLKKKLRKNNNGNNHNIC
jgi:hypothetical protein